MTLSAFRNLVQFEQARLMPDVYTNDRYHGLFPGRGSRCLEWIIWACARQNQQNDCRPSEDSDQPGHPPSLIEYSLYAWRSIGSLATHRAHSEDWSDWADAQADLSLRWAHEPICWFCRAAAHFFSGGGCFKVIAVLPDVYLLNDLSRKMSRLMTKPTKWHVRPAKTDQPGHPSSLVSLRCP